MKALLRAVQVVLILLSGLSINVLASSTTSLQFTDITTSAGILSQQQSWGAAWGDYNGDGYPDIYVTNHYDHPFLFKNNKNGTFSEVSDQVWTWLNREDQHGAAWADVDNDGDQDLMQLVGAQDGQGAGPKHLLENTNGVFTDYASLKGLDYPLSRGRTPLWLDYDNDGKLDLLMTGGPRVDVYPAALFHQTATGFELANIEAGISNLLGKTGHTIAMLSDLSGDQRLDVILNNENHLFPYTIFSTAALPFEDVTLTSGAETYDHVQDATIADFNNDTLPDIFMARSKQGSSDLFQSNKNNIKAYISVPAKARQQSFSFTPGHDHIRVQLFLRTTEFSSIHIGANGHQPASYIATQIDEIGTSYKFSLSRLKRHNMGIQVHDAASDAGVYIGYDNATSRWLVEIDSSETIKMILTIVISSTGELNDVTLHDFARNRSATKQVLLLNTGSGFVDQSASAGFTSVPISAVSVVAGDFDNDMDVDLFTINRRNVKNLPAVLFVNNGDGTFSKFDIVGPVASGLADTVTTGDFDQDGRLDLFITNGNTRTGTYPFYLRGKNRLLRNTTINTNHWLEIDLVGKISNRNGIGARVLVTAGGVKQIREANGGMHQFAQDNKRLHFGLGGNAVATSVKVLWPSGLVTDVLNVASNQVITITEAP